MTSRAERGRDVVREVFGGAFYQQGRGFYSSLELFAILRGEILFEHAEREVTPSCRLLPEDGPALYLRPSHDHARRLLVADSEVVQGVFGTVETRDAVKGLLRGLEAPVPGRLRVNEQWQLRHLYPYPAEAIHYDAVERRGRVSVERYQFRGAGGFAHRVLRTDPDQKRLQESRDEFRRLLTDSGSAVGQLLKALSAHDDRKIATTAEDLENAPPFEDEVEAKSFVSSAGTIEATVGSSYDTRWTRLLREGVHRLLTREDLTDFDTVDSLLHWVPYCISMHQLAMARRVLGADEDAAVLYDAGYHAGPLRAEARSHFGRAIADIKDSLLHVAERHAPDVLASGAAWWKGPRTFFTTTLFAVGASNANSGQRHFELRPQLLQTIIRAQVVDPLPLDVFIEKVLLDELRIVCDTVGATTLDNVGVDLRDLRSNGQALLGRIQEIGMLRSLSDATQMVGVHE
jgi:hypothetical protein